MNSERAPAVFDAVDRIILREASSLLATVTADQVAVLDDTSGGLALAAAEMTRVRVTSVNRVRVHCDSLADERRVYAEASLAQVPLALEQQLGPALLSGVKVVLLRLPKGLAALDEIAEAVARHADPQVRLLAGGRAKHMSHGMNGVLANHFSSVTASLGQQKSRVLSAAGPLPSAEPRYPVSEQHPDLGLTVHAHGGAFAGSAVDLGTRFLISFLPQLDSAAVEVVDLGCGTGVLATLLARRLPAARVQAVDDSSAACRSTEATARSNGVADRVSVRRVHLLAGTEDHSVDLVLCNPPFHRGTSRDSDVAFAMFAEAGRVLRPGGEIWTVYNTHLPYLTALRRLVGPTRIIGQNPRYVVTRTVATAAVRPSGSRLPAAASERSPDSGTRR